MHSNPLFMLRVALARATVAITVWEKPQLCGATHTRLDIRVKESWLDDSDKRVTRTVFKRGVLYVGIPAHQSIDGNYAKKAVLECVAMKPGDTDSDYFADYTSKQLAFAVLYGEELSMISLERYGE